MVYCRNELGNCTAAIQWIQEEGCIKVLFWSNNNEVIQASYGEFLKNCKMKLKEELILLHKEITEFT